MRRTKQLLCFVLLIAMLVCSMSVAASAADLSAGFISLTGPATAETGGQVRILVNAEKASRIADGRLAVAYDARVLSYVGAEPGEAWDADARLTLSDNGTEPGRVVLAFAAVSTAGEGSLVVLKFQAKAPGTAGISVDVSDSYVTGLPSRLLAADTSVEVSGEALDAFQVVFEAGGKGSFAGGAAAYTVYVTPGEAIGAVPALTPDSGYSLAGWKCAEDGETYTSAQVEALVPTGGLSFTAQYAAQPVIPGPGDPTEPVAPGECDGGDDCPSRNFTDVNFTGDYHSGIDFVVANGYMKGTSATTFSPNLSMTRAMMVTILYRMAGEPAVSGESAFTDVEEDDYFYKAVLWATNEGITKGTSATTFSPRVQLTREQLATFLFRYAQYAGMETAVRGELSGYTDASSVSGYARTAMEWAVGSGIVKGTTDTTLEPQGTALRVQIAVMVWRFLSAQA